MAEVQKNHTYMGSLQPRRFSSTRVLLVEGRLFKEQVKI